MSFLAVDRIRVGAMGAALLGLLLAGCTSPTSSATGTKSANNVSPSATPALNIGTTAGNATPRADADAFLKALRNGDVKSASSQISASFKKQMTKPVYEEEQKVGYSEEDMQKHLKAWVAGRTASNIRTEVLAPEELKHRFAAIWRAAKAKPRLRCGWPKKTRAGV